MKNHKIYIGIFTILFCFFKWNTVSANPPSMEKVGSIKVDLGENAWVEKDLWVWNLPGGKLTLSGGGTGNLIGPCGEWGELRDSGTLAMNVHCNIKMDDGSVLLWEYRGRLKMNETGGKNMEVGKPITPTDGMDYWISIPLVKTTSEKYAWLNESIFIGKGTFFQPPAEGIKGYVTYDIYKVNY